MVIWKATQHSAALEDIGGMAVTHSKLPITELGEWLIEEPICKCKWRIGAATGYYAINMLHGAPVPSAGADWHYKRVWGKTWHRWWDAERQTICATFQMLSEWICLIAGEVSQLVMLWHGNLICKCHKWDCHLASHVKACFVGQSNRSPFWEKSVRVLQTRF